MFHLRNYSDEELLDGLHKGDKKAYEVIFKAYWYPLFKIANARLRSPADAEEIVQDVFTSLWKNRRSTVVSNLSHYLFAAVRKRTLNVIRTQLNNQKYCDYYLRFFSDHAMSTDDAVGFVELKNSIEKALLQLPEKSQQVFRLNRFQGLSITQISESLNIPKRTIEHHLTQALRQLRLHLKDYILMMLPFLFSEP